MPDSTPLMKRTRHLTNSAACYAAAFLMAIASGCTTTNTPPPVVQAPALPPPAQESAPPSALSYGMVTGRVQKGATTQQEVIELFGGPSTMTTDRDGTEIWMYDRTTSTTSSTHAHSGAQAERSSAGALAAFLGLPMFSGVGVAGGAISASQSQSAQVSQGQASVTRSVRTLTFIIKWNADKTVKDYAVRQSSY